MVPATNEPIADGRERRPAAAGLGHLVALERGRHRGALAGRVDQDRGGRAAIHAAVIDAGEHDQRAAGIELVGDRQQQRDRQRRADAGQHADRGAEQHADQRIEQVHRLHGDRHAVRERGEGVHRHSSRSSGPGGQAQRQQPVEQRDRSAMVDAPAPMARSVRMARRPKAADVVTNSADVARMKPPPRPMMAISSARPPRISSTGLGIGALARRQIAAQRVDQIADREQRRGRWRSTTGIASGPMPYIVVACSWRASHTSTAASAGERQRR